MFEWNKQKFAGLYLASFTVFGLIKLMATFRAVADSILLIASIGTLVAALVGIWLLMAGKSPWDGLFVFWSIATTALFVLTALAIRFLPTAISVAVICVLHSAVQAANRAMLLFKKTGRKCSFFDEVPASLGLASVFAAIAAIHVLFIYVGALVGFELATLAFMVCALFASLALERVFTRRFLGQVMSSI